MAEEAENNDKNAPVSIKRAHGQEQQIKMDVLDMVNRAEDPFAIIYHLVKVKGLKLAAARKVLEKNKDGAMNVAEAIDRLKQMREELATFRKNLSSLTSGQEE